MKFVWLLLIAFTLSSCKKQKEFEAPELEDQPEITQVQRTNLNIEAPAYGVVLSGGLRPQIQVSVEASDSPRLKVGEKATIYIPTLKTRKEFTVSRVAKNVSEETGQALAWLTPIHDVSFLSGDFVEAWITLAVKRLVLSVPRAAVFIRDGKTWLLKKGLPAKTDAKVTFTPTEVVIGEASNDRVEIVSGIQENDTIASGAAIGFLFPEFKASQEE